MKRIIFALAAFAFIGPAFAQEGEENDPTELAIHRHDASITRCLSGNSTPPLQRL